MSTLTIRTERRLLQKGMGKSYLVGTEIVRGDFELEIYGIDLGYARLLISRRQGLQLARWLVKNCEVSK